MFKGLKSQSGSVLVLILATLTVMLIIAVGFTAWFMQGGRQAAFQRTEKKEYQRTETAVERAILRLKDDAAFRNQFIDATPNSSATFALTIDGRIVNVTVIE